MTQRKGTRSTPRLWATLSGVALSIGLMTSVQAETPDSRTTSRTYNDYGQVTSIDGPRTDVLDITTYEYDERGNRLSVTNALGHVTQYGDYERNGLPGTVTDPNGLVTHLEYDWQGKVTEQCLEAPQGDLITRYVYDPVGQLIEIHPPAGASLYYDYDAAQRLTGLRTGDGARLSYELDDLGNVVSVETFDETGALVRRHQQAFDGLSRLQARIGGTDSQTTEYDYDADGNRTGITDAKQQSSSQQFDALNRLSELTDRAQGVTHFEYNDRDQITAVTDPTGLTSRYDYNGHGELIAVHSPDTGTTTYAYDGAGNRTGETNANGQITEFHYDALNRRTAIRYPANPDQNLTYDYDDTSVDNNGTANAGLGRLTRVQFDGGERRFRYDALGRLVAETQVIGTQAYTARHVYNALGQLSAQQLPSGAWLGYDYSDQSRLAGLYLQNSAEATADQRQPLVTDLDYLPFGPITHQTYGNGIEQTNHYDLDYRLTEQRSAVWDSGYYYDLNSNLDQLIDSLSNAGGTDDNSGLYHYDALDRLIIAEQADATRDYHYDPVGNRLTKTTQTDTNTETTDYGYSAQSHRIMYEADWLYQFEAAGNLISNGRFDFDYNEQGQLARVFEAGTDTLVAEYAYNASRQRISKTVPYSGPDHAALADAAEQQAAEHQQQAQALNAQASSAEQQASQYQQQADQALADAATQQAEADQHQQSADVLTEQGSDAQTKADQWRQDAQAQRDRIDEPATSFGQWLTNLIAGGLSDFYDWVANQYQASADDLLAQAEQAQSQAATAQAATNELNQQAESLQQQANQAMSEANAFTAQAQEQNEQAAQALVMAEEHRTLADNPTNTTKTTQFVYRPDGLLAGEYTEAGTPIREYAYLGTKPLAILSPPGSAAAANDQEYDRYYIHSDHLSTPKLVTDQAQETVWKATHTPFGKATALVEDIENPLRFPGQYHDEETGLHYNWHRYYDPSTGRYITSDPIGLEGGLNTYGYALQNPLRYTDPTGLISWDCSRLATGASAFAGGANKIIYTCRSECVDGKKQVVRFHATATGPNLGLEAEMTGSHPTLSDNNDVPDPDVFNGEYFEAGAQYVFGIGYGTGAVSIGNGQATGSLTGFSAGLGIGGAEMWGESQVIWSREEQCEDDDCNY